METIFKIFLYNRSMMTETLPHNHDAAGDEKHPSLQLFDALGIFASALCMVHCLALPLIVAALPFTGAWLGHDQVHYLLAGWVLLFCLAAIVPGYFKHRRLSVLVTMLVGLGLVLFATFGLHGGAGESLEIPLITVGNLLVISAHWRNRRINHHHGACQHLQHSE